MSSAECFKGLIGRTGQAEVQSGSNMGRRTGFGEVGSGEVRVVVSTAGGVDRAKLT